MTGGRCRYIPGSLMALLLLALTGCGSTLPLPEIRPAQPVARSVPKEPAPVAPSEKELIAAVDPATSVFFTPGGSSIDDEGRRKLADMAQRLKASPETVVTLIGHTDNLGSPSYNLAIAEQRVNAVYEVLRKHGVGLTQIHRYGVGREMGAPTCRSAACRQTMRRVEMVLQKP